MRIDYEEIIKLKDEMTRINKLDLAEVELFRNGVKVKGVK